MDLNLIWFILVGVLLAGYAILDGFDLGVGALHLFAKGDTERRLMINSIGPVWDGNEVWLVTGGGAIFAAFPDVYATLASGFYLAVFLLIFSLIFRAVAIEFRSKQPFAWWRQTWDVAFSVASILCAFLLGVIEIGVGVQSRERAAVVVRSGSKGIEDFAQPVRAAIIQTRQSGRDAARNRRSEQNERVGNEDRHHRPRRLPRLDLLAEIFRRTPDHEPGNEHRQ